MDQFILFGDSITQQSFSPEDEGGYFGPALSNAYIRRLDIVNRGFSGYNTNQALQVLPKFMPSPAQSRVRFMTIFFGANDARLPDTPGGPDQHVPLDQYKNNLRKIATHPCVQAHEDIRLILITPPPVDERKTIEADLVRYPGSGPILRRMAMIIAQYAQEVQELGEQLQIPVLDIWSAMVQRANSPTNSLDHEQLPGLKDAPQSKVLQEYLLDGLHFSRSAYVLLFEELMALIEKTWPDQMPERLPFALPRWDDEEAWKDAKALDARTKL